MTTRKAVLLLLAISRMSCAFAQSTDTLGLLKEATGLLKANKITASKLILEQKYLFLHEYLPFKQVVKAYAQESKLTPIWKGVDGIPFVLTLQLVDKDNKPLEGVTTLIFQTDQRGYYFSDTTIIPNPYKAEEASRIFAYGKTDKSGTLKVSTIRPGGYPYLLRGKQIPGHFHLEFYRGNDTLTAVTFFVDEPQFAGKNAYASQVEQMQQRWDPTRKRVLALAVVPRQKNKKQFLNLTLQWLKE